MPYPKIIYKYRDWDCAFHKNILLNNELYFASPKDFNDPFDCRITQDYKLLNTKEKQQEYVDKVLIETFTLQGKFPKDPLTAMKEVDKRFEDIDKLQIEYDAISFHEHNLRYGVACFSAIWDNILMWSHYANKHTGFCMGFNEEKIRKYGAIDARGGMVTYDDVFPEIDPFSTDEIKSMFLVTHYKSSDWHYEKEYRLVKLYYPNIPTTQERIFTFSNDFIAEVILGLNISESNKNEIISSCLSRNIPVFEIKKVRGKFQLVRKQIAP